MTSSVSGPGSIQEINLLAVPVALNFDQAPGPDGFIVKVYATAAKRPKPVPIESGRLEIFMFDGTPDGSAQPNPLRTWTFTAEQLRPFQIQSSIGVGYQLAPVWGDAKPTATKISVLVRYTPSQGASITSAPSVISITAR